MRGYIIDRAASSDSNKFRGGLTCYRWSQYSETGLEYGIEISHKANCDPTMAICATYCDEIMELLEQFSKRSGLADVLLHKIRTDIVEFEKRLDESLDEAREKAHSGGGE